MELEQPEALDPKKLKQENDKLKKALKELTVEKNLMQYQMLRGFNKLLTTKKRRIRKLEKALKKANSGGAPGKDSEEELYQCDSCTCASLPEKRQLKTRRSKVISCDSDSDTTMDPGSDYGSETELDEEPASNKAGPVMIPKLRSQTPPREDVLGPIDAAQDDKVLLDVSAADSESILGPAEENDGPKSSQSDYDMDCLVDEVCK